MKAFPRNATTSDKLNGITGEAGMDLRDYFAAKAMQAMLSDRETYKGMVYDAKNRLNNTGQTVNEASIQFELAKSFYLISDAMMEVRNERS